MSETAPVAQDDTKAHRRRFLARFVPDQSGSTAIEFVMLAIPFSMLVFAILESCIAFAGQQILSNAADDVARQFRTGQKKVADFPSGNDKKINEQKLKDLICPKLEVLVAKDCPGLLFDLKNFTTFKEVADSKMPLTASGDVDKTQLTVEPGPAMSKNLLRVFYKWPVITNYMSWFDTASQPGDDTTLLFAVMVWQNEPFND